MKQLKQLDNIVQAALSNSFFDLQGSLDSIIKAFKDFDTPWLEQCVRETVIRWHQLSRSTEETKGK